MTEVGQIEMSSMASMCIECFPSLDLLEINCTNQWNETSDRVLDGLSGLLNHPTLRRLTIDNDSRYWDGRGDVNFERKVQERLGQSMSISYRDHYQSRPSPMITGSFFEEWAEDDSQVNTLQPRFES